MRVALWVAWILVIAAALFWIATAKAEPVRFTVETGTLHAKWGVREEGLGFPIFSRPKWYIDADFSWRPPLLRDLGIATIVGFRWQALTSDIPGSGGFRYVDGPKVALRGSWALR